MEKFRSFKLPKMSFYDEITFFIEAEEFKFGVLDQSFSSYSGIFPEGFLHLYLIYNNLITIKDILSIIK